jgi:putative ABC transport system permease protein
MTANWSKVMLENYLKVALRNFFRHYGYSLINVFGLAIGLSCCLVIFVHIQDELNFDRFHEKSDRIYRIVRDWRVPGKEPSLAANSPAAVGPQLLAEFPAVENFTRIMFSHPQRVLISHAGRRFYESGFYWADSSVFEVFSFRLERGDPKTALTEVNSLVLTVAMARKYFGDTDPIGKIVTIEGWSRDDYEVTGVLAEVPENSHLQFDFLGSVRGADQRYSFAYSGEGQWTNSLGYNYILLKEGAEAGDLQAQLADFGERHLGEFGRERGFTPGFVLQPLHDIHLHAGLAVEPTATSDMIYIYMFAAIAILILFIACINYMNLATARSARRAREVGIRKVLGAHRTSLVGQFIGEAMLVTVLAFVLALILAEFLLPLFSDISGKSLALSYSRHAGLLAGFLAVAGAVGLLAGSYPAFVLSKFQPVVTVRGKKVSGRTDIILRKGLIAVQFVVSIGLIIATIVVARQLTFMRNKPLGFDKEQIAVIPIREGKMRERAETLKQEFLRHSAILEIAAGAGVPGRTMMVDGFPVRSGNSSQAVQTPMKIFGVDYDYFETLGIELVQGRYFSREAGTDATSAFVINETAAKVLGWDEPLGLQLELVMDNGKSGAIIGVVRDFHLTSLHEKIEPMVFHIWPERFSCFVVKMNSEKVAATIDYLQTTTEALFPQQPFEFFFLDEAFQRQYRNDERVGRVFSYSAGLAIFIACLGLLGLASFTVEQRTKEIGVRKVLGASASSVVVLFGRDFAVLIVLANAIAGPVAGFVMHGWLQDFAYRIAIEWWVFVLAGGLALMIALLTVSTQAIRAALASPVESLRYE